MVYIKFLIHWFIVCLYYGKKNFPKVHPPKMRHYGFLFLKTFPGGGPRWVLPWFWSRMGRGRFVPNLVIYSKLALWLCLYPSLLVKISLYYIINSSIKKVSNNSLKKYKFHWFIFSFCLFHKSLAYETFCPIWCHL